MRKRLIELPTDCIIGSNDYSTHLGIRGYVDAGLGQAGDGGAGRPGGRRRDLGVSRGGGGHCARARSLGAVPCTARWHRADMYGFSAFNLV